MRARARGRSLLALASLVAVACASNDRPPGFSDAEIRKLAACNAKPTRNWRDLPEALTSPGESLLRTYREGVEQRAVHWTSYQAVAAEHLERGEIGEAAAVYLRYPPFSDVRTSKDPSVDAELAAAAGAEILWRGDAEHAASLFEAAAQLTPWSAAALAGGFHLAVVREDWTTAADLASQRLRRCAGSDAIRDWILIELLRGHSTRTRALLAAIAEAPEYEASPWVATFVDLRIAGRSDPEIVAWLSDPAIAFHSWAIQEQAPLLLLMDRPVADTSAGQLRTIHEWMIRRNPKYQRLPPERIQEAALDSSESHVRLAEIHADWREGRVDEAWKGYLRGANRRGGGGGPPWILPLVLWSAIQADQAGPIEQHLERLEATRRKWNPPTRSDDPRHTRRALHSAALLAAVRSGLAGDHATAQTQLRNAMHAGVRGEGHWLRVSHQRLELSEALYRETGNEGYREVALELARKQARHEPWLAWSWAVIARYAPSHEERQRALRRALYLDRRSDLLDGVAPLEVRSAQAWLEQHSPFAGAS